MFRRRSLPKGIRHEVHMRDNFKCTECGKGNSEESLEVDHIIPISKGGTDELFNLRTLCKTCNREKSDLIHSNTNKISIDRFFTICPTVEHKPESPEDLKPIIKQLTDPEIPTIFAIPRTDYPEGLKFYCGYCKRWHLHGGMEGHRVSHCQMNSPLYERGYYLKKIHSPSGLDHKQQKTYERGIKENWKGQFLMR